MLTLLQFLQAASIPVTVESYKVHLATGNPLEAFFRGEFKQWQEYQTRRNFPCNMVIGLIQLHRNEWLFAGVYRILGNKKISEKHIEYSTELLQGQDEIIGRLVVHHKRSGRAPYLKGKIDGKDFIVSQILPKRLTVREFPGYNSICISYTQLETIISQRVQSWHGALSNIKGIYLISDTNTGKLYVGKADGANGIWQRWATYIKDGHGGNKDLRVLLKREGKEYKTNYQFSILEIADTHTTDPQILERESYWKNVLCSREYGYNSN